MRILVVSDLHPESKGSRFESPAATYVQRWGLCSNNPANALSVCEAGGSGSEELKKYPPLSPAVL